MLVCCSEVGRYLSLSKSPPLGVVQNTLANLAERFLVTLYLRSTHKYYNIRPPLIHDIYSQISESRKRHLLQDQLFLHLEEERMEYLIRFVHQHEPFRKPEVDSLAELFNIKIRWISYSEHVG